MSAISVVVPYYQREPGHLRRAIRSVLRQKGVPTPQIIVVDDGSPFPAAEEFAALDFAERQQVTLLCQQNQGPGPARNTGLDAVPREAEWVAFLDSDDEWEDRHLERALTALRQGYDFFFADLKRDGDPTTHYGATGFAPLRHRPLPYGEELYAYVGDFFTANITYSPVGTSTVVYRKSACDSLRFPPTRDTPGEDLIFWLECAHATSRIAFDGTVQVHYGHGNITVSEDWRSSHSLRTNAAYGAYIDDIAARFALNDAQAALVARMRHKNREVVASIALAMLRRAKCPPAAVFGPYLRRHPAVIADMVRVAGGAGMRRLFRRRTGEDAAGNRS